jgi:hypothetical protein
METTKFAYCPASAAVETTGMEQSADIAAQTVLFS